MMPRLPEVDKSCLKLSHSPLVNQLHIYDLKINPRLQELLDIDEGNDMTKKLFEDLQWRAENRYNVVVEIKGSRGSGKSTLARGLKGVMDMLREKKGKIEDIVFTRQEYMDDFKDAKPGQTFIIDEDFGFQTQTGASRIRETMMLAEQTFRIEEVSNIACSVAPSYSHLYDYYFLAYDFDKKQGVNRAIVYNTSQLGGMFSRPMGYILFPSKHFLNPDIEKKYKEKKEMFTKKVKQGKVRTLQEDYDTYAENSIKKFHWDTAKPTERMMKVYLRREFPHMANTERDDILDTLMVRMYEIHGSAKGKKT